MSFQWIDDHHGLSSPLSSKRSEKSESIEIEKSHRHPKTNLRNLIRSHSVIEDPRFEVCSPLLRSWSWGSTEVALRKFKLTHQVESEPEEPIKPDPCTCQSQPSSLLVSLPLTFTPFTSHVFPSPSRSTYPKIENRLIRSSPSSDSNDDRHPSSSSTSNSDQTQPSDLETTDDEDSARWIEKPKLTRTSFFDEDVIFGLDLPHLKEPIDFSLMEELDWELWAQRRLLKMVEKQPEIMTTLSSSPSSHFPHALKREVIVWLLDFEPRFKTYPHLSLPTRHRAITIFGIYLSKPMRRISDRSMDQTRHLLRQIGLACLSLACKVDIDVFKPLFVLPLRAWAKAVEISQWVSITALQIGALEQKILEALSYQISFPTVFDFLAELTIANPILESLMSECGEDWETIQEAFALILDHAVQHRGYLQYPCSVLSIAVLFLSLDECIFDQPMRRTEEEASSLGQIWWRESNGLWSHSFEPESRIKETFKLGSENTEGIWVTIVEEELKLRICEMMKLDLNEVERCKEWCMNL